MVRPSRVGRQTEPKGFSGRGALSGAIALWAAVYGWGKWLNRPQAEHRAERRSEQVTKRRYREFLYEDLPAVSRCAQSRS